MEPRGGLDGARIRYRIGQGLAYLRPRRAEQVDQRLRMLLSSAEFQLLSRLSIADRSHHLTVYDRIRRHGRDDPDLLKAALLHDVGKVDDDARVGLVHRTLAVIVRAVAPGLLTVMGRETGPRWRRSLYLVDAHPERGAKLAREAGCNQRVCWIIAHHHDDQIDDEDLNLLRRVDDGRLP